MERHVPELYDWHTNKVGEAFVVRCAIMDVVSWFPGVLQQCHLRGLSKKKKTLGSTRRLFYGLFALKLSVRTTLKRTCSTHKGQVSACWRDRWEGREGGRVLLIP